MVNEMVQRDAVADFNVFVELMRRIEMVRWHPDLSRDLPKISKPTCVIVQKCKTIVLSLYEHAIERNKDELSFLRIL